MQSISRDMTLDVITYDNNWELSILRKTIHSYPISFLCNVMYDYRFQKGDTMVRIGWDLHKIILDGKRCLQ